MSRRDPVALSTRIFEVELESARAERAAAQWLDARLRGFDIASHEQALDRALDRLRRASRRLQRAQRKPRS